MPYGEDNVEKSIYEKLLNYDKILIILVNLILMIIITNNNIELEWINLNYIILLVYNYWLILFFLLLYFGNIMIELY